MQLRSYHVEPDEVWKLVCKSVETTICFPDHQAEHMKVATDLKAMKLLKCKDLGIQWLKFLLIL
ncbi:hypothetical protein OUZ56_027239 [Daphnia magna]|uniref:Uncharacterized protein n=1 Tax=Daphnia magna TaxID=35525 RepID=A0ABQ9ZP74_9CRUS|nr:hypothetical protein OUZ56_027239 [Daphnia magna]